MSFITCPECKKQISSLAIICPDCGYPVSFYSDSGFVIIKLPRDIMGVSSNAREHRVCIRGKNIYWSGTFGQTAFIKIDAPTSLSFVLGDNVRFFAEKVFPHSVYKLEYVRTKKSLAEYRLIEI